MHEPLTSMIARSSMYMHLGAFILHLAIGCIVVAIGVANAPVDTSRIVNQVLTPGLVGNADRYFINVPAWTSLVFFITSASHLINWVYAWLYPLTWVTWVERGANPFRWLEYSLTASWMTVLLSIISQVFDVWELVYVFLTVFAVMTFGMIIDVTFFLPAVDPLEFVMYPSMTFFSHPFNIRKRNEVTLLPADFSTTTTPAAMPYHKPYTSHQTGTMWGLIQSVPVTYQQQDRYVSGAVDSRQQRPGGNHHAMLISTELAHFIFYTCYWVATAICVVPWIRIFYNFYMLGANIPDNKTYNLVAAVIVLEACAFFSFAIVMAVMAFQSVVNRRYSEIIYVSLSFTAKILLGIFVLIGGLGMNFADTQ